MAPTRIGRSNRDRQAARSCCLRPLFRGRHPAALVLSLFFHLAGFGGASAQDGSILTTVAGGGERQPVTGIPALRASLHYPGDVAAGPNGEVFFYVSSTLYKVSPDGILTVLLLAAPPSPESDGSPILRPYVNNFEGITLDSNGNLLVLSGSALLRVDPQGILTRIAGFDYGFAGDGGPALDARFSHPGDLAVDSAGSIYVADAGNRRIRKITPDGIVRTFLQTGEDPVDRIAADRHGNLFYTLHNRPKIYKALPDGTTTELALSGPDTGLGYIRGLEVDSEGTLWVSTSGSSNRILRVDANGVATRAAGSGQYGGAADGTPALESNIGPTRLAVDRAGAVVFVENLRIRKVNGLAAPGLIAGTSLPDRAGLPTADTYVIKPDLPGYIAHLAGNGSATLCGDGGPARAAWLSGPADMARDASGALYFVDRRNQRIRKVSADGVISTVAGGGTAPPEQTDNARELNFNGGPGGGGLQGIAVDPSGALYVAFYHKVWKLTPEGQVLHYAGTGTANPYSGAGEYSGDGGPATQAALNTPTGLALGPDGSLYIADTGNHRIRKVTPQGVITTAAGLGTPGYNGDSMAATAAQLFAPAGIAVGPDGNLWIADTENHRIRRVDENGEITTAAGNGLRGFAGDGGPARSAQLALPTHVLVDPSGGLVILDSQNRRVRAVDAGGTIRTVAGSGARGTSPDGVAATEAAFENLRGLAFGKDGALLLSDAVSNLIRTVDPSGTLGAFAGRHYTGSPVQGPEYLPPPARGCGDGGPALEAVLVHPTALIVDGAGGFYFAAGNLVRRVDAQGIISTVAGGGTAHRQGDDGVPATRLALNHPQGLALDGLGNLYIADTGNHRVRKVSADGTATRIAGADPVDQAPAGEPLGDYTGDGGPANRATLHSPSGVAVDAAGNVFIADTNNHRVRKVSPGGAISTVAGNGPPGVGNGGHGGDGGPAPLALLDQPRGILLDAGGNLFVLGFRVLRKVDSLGVITTVAGKPDLSGKEADGIPAAEANLYATSMAMDAVGTLFLNGSGSGSQLRKIGTDGIIDTVGTVNPNFNGSLGPYYPTLDRPVALAADGRGNLLVADDKSYYLQSGVILSVLNTAAQGMTAPGRYLPTSGDADLDGRTDTADAVKVLRHVVGIEALTPAQTAAADHHPDGKVDIADAVAMLRSIVGL